MPSAPPWLARVRRVLPIAEWLPAYRRHDLPGDLIAGVIVTVMLVPQSLAYAMLAGLPPEVGLYASVLPLVAYALFGSSRVLAVGPVAVVSLLVASALGRLATPESPEYAAAALALALLTGLILAAMAVARLGFLANCLSHPVISGFISASAILIAASQLRHLFGITVPAGGDRLDEVLVPLIGRLGETNPATLLIGAGSVALLLWMRGPFGRLVARAGASRFVAETASRVGPIFAVVFFTALVWAFGLDRTADVAVVGALPAGLPPLTVPVFDPVLWRDLLPAAVLIALVGFVESVSVARSLAAKRREKIDPDRELLGLGAANVAAAFSGGFPVTGGFARSVVNYAAGARTGLASLLTALLIAVTALTLTPLFYYLPTAVLAATIIVAVLGLVDVATFRRAWIYNRADAASLAVTFVAALAFGVEAGIVAGVVVSLALYLWRTSRPHMAIVGRVDDTEHFRNVLRHRVRTAPHILAVRVDESLYFANTKYLEDALLAAVAERPEIRHLVLICSAVNFIDASALETLESLRAELRDAGVTLHLAEVKGPVMDRLKRTDFLERLGEGRVFLSTHDAMVALGGPLPRTAEPPGAR
jgi:sulfate permease, SulP family